ncbi:hypothetical protein JCGZ_01533 [Jatropha curcas]|uniref:Amino acid transporter transmembrane domain-containing protein n=1 Tax=Jatropha curcas TaxID=180498 RepID=A0A067LCQ9_JATCU|nr:hypothetical protein JCGZ_01533 [Jatropha curcas]
MSENGDKEEGANSSKELDAGALFVLKSRGSWVHCGYHLTTSIVAPALLSLPYALSLLGWFGGVLCLTLRAVVYLQPTNEVLEQKFADAKGYQFSIRNMGPSLIFRSLAVIIATTVAAMFPFFGDINAVIGAFGFIPLDFIFPMVFYNVLSGHPNRP